MTAHGQKEPFTKCLRTSLPFHFSLLPPRAALPLPPLPVRFHLTIVHSSAGGHMLERHDRVLASILHPPSHLSSGIRYLHVALLSRGETSRRLSAVPSLPTPPPLVWRSLVPDEAPLLFYVSLRFRVAFRLSRRRICLLSLQNRQHPA